MREILFRGKCKDSGKWYEGYYVHLRKTTYCFKEDYDRNPDNDMHQIIFEEMMDWGLPNQHFRVDVLPETVGQYTGLTDKNGKKIFEGDIVKCSDATYDYGFVAVVMFGNPNGEYNWGFQLKRIRGASANTDILLWVDMEEGGAYTEVIGNIHDNPELLKGE